MDKANIMRIESKYVLKNIFDNLKQNKFLDLIRHSKALQNKLDITIMDYNEYTQLEIEIFPKIPKKTQSTFINILNEEDQPHYHIYFNNKKKRKKKVFYKEKKWSEKNKNNYRL